MILKNKLKTLILFILNIVCWFLPKKRASIILYHSVNNNDVFLTVSPDDFRRQLEYLKNKKYNVIKLKSLVELIIKNGVIPGKTVVLTFDDGFLSHYRTVFPILKKYNLPATFFISTGKLEAEINNSENKPQATLNWPELQEMNKSGLIDIEPHGVAHIELDKLDKSKAEEEIKGSSREIESKLNKKCLLFAYPRGKYNREIIEILRSKGFKAAVSTKNGLVKNGDDLFRLRRNTVDSSCGNMVQFRARLNYSIAILNKILGHEY